MDKKYLDKIVGYLVEDTTYNIPKDMSFPFGDIIRISFPFARLSYNYKIEEVKSMGMRPWYMGDDNLEFLNSTYGLDEKESTYVMNKYIKNICRKILNDFKSNSINESIDDKKQSYLDKIVRFLVEDTIIYINPNVTNIKTGTITYPFFYLTMEFSTNNFLTYEIPSIQFLDYCRDNYGLTDNEISYMWGKYRKIILKKIGSKPKSINESENKMISAIERVLDIEYPNLSDSSIDWAEFNCGMGICCDPYAIGFVLPGEEYQYNDYLFKLVDGKNYSIMGDYPIEIYEELPEPCYNRPDITNPEFDVIIIHHEMMEILNNYFNKTKIWESELVTVLNRKFGFNATKFGGFGWW